MVLKTAWQPVHKWLVMHRIQILLVFRAMHFAVVVSIICAFILLLVDLQWWLPLSEFARQAGTVSALCYLGTLVPGMLKRFGIFPLVRASAMLFRRQLGVLMFWLAILHQAVMVTFPMVIAYGGLSLAVYGQHEVYGLLGVGLLFPLWVTSNDESVKQLGKLWHWIHALTYVALFFIYLHVSNHEGTIPWLFKGVMALEVLSWLYYWVQSMRKKVPDATPV